MNTGGLNKSKLSGTPLAIQILKELDDKHECGIPLKEAKWAVINAGCLTVGMKIEFMWKKLVWLFRSISRV